MRSIRNEIKHIMRAVTVLTVLFAMTLVFAGSANATVIGPLGNPAIARPSIGSQAFVSAPVFNPFFSPPIVNPFFGADLDGVGLGLGVGIGGLGVGGFGVGLGGLGVGLGEAD